MVDENGEPLVVYHGTGTYKEFSKTHIFNPEMLGTATNAESAKKGFFFAESKGTAVEYAGLDQIEAPFRSWLDMPSSINEIIGDIRKVILETDAEYVPSTVWEAYGQFVEDIFNSKSNEERLELYLSFTNNESLYYDVMEQEIPQDIIDDAEESLLQDRGFYVERVEGDEDYQEYLEAKEEMQDNAYDLARSIFYEKIEPLSMLFSGADRNKLEPHIRMFDFSKQYDPNDFKIMQVFLSVKNPLDYYFKEGYRDEKFNDLMQKAIADNKDGAIFRNVKDGGGFDNIYVAFAPAQIKSATGNVGTFSESNDIRYQIDNAIQSASPDMQDRIAKIMEKQKKVQQAANATYRELATKIGRTTSVYEWDSLMRKSLVTAIRNAFPGAAPMNIEKYAALEETLGELDPGLEDHAKEIKRIKAQLRRMVAMDKKFRDALEDVSGFSDIADIPFEGLFPALENTNPAAYDRYFKDETFDILLKALPKIKTAYDGQFTMQTLQRIVDLILSGNDPNVGRDVSELAFLQPQRLFAELFGKAGINTINYAYHGTLKLAAYEMEYTPHLREINRLLMTADNNRGSAYDGDDLDIIGRTIFEVDGNSEISNKLETIQERLAEWAEENNAVINSKDVEEIYNEKEYLKDIMRGFIAEWNANPERTQKIGIREDYDNPRKYNWGDISDITTKGGKYLYTPGNARERSKQDFSDGLDYDTNIFNAYSNYMYSMTRYMAFYDLANYVEGSSILYASKGGKAGQKKMASGFDLDLSLAQHKSSAYASKMIEDYVRNTIGYHKKDTPKGRLLASARTNVYASMLASNVIMTVLNFNQRNLIHSVVDQNIAKQVRTDVAFWTGLFKPSNEEYPTLSGIMQAYVTANQSLIAELAAEAKRCANQGRTALSRAYYKHSAYNAEILRLSPFSLAELGNRAYAHAAGVYQVTQNSMAYKEYVASGMSRHQAMERALSEDSNLRRAAITYGGIINAEINADANRAFSPYFFSDASKIKKVAIFLRYGVTLALLELRTYGGARDIKSLLSPDLFRLLTSGNVKAATAAQTIQAGAIMKSMLHPKRIAELVRKGQVSTAETSKNLITVNEVNMVRDAITWALDEQAKHTEEEFHNIIRGKSGAKRAMAALMAFSVSEVLLRSLLELLFSLIPWWQGKKKFIETDVIENIASVLGLFQGLKTASNVRLGSTLAPDLGAYNPTAKTTTKALSQYVLRLTPYAGLANYMGKVFTGKYFSDLFWDEVYD
ncbi:MAG: hypothetical protein BWY95_01368 [Bacteroidetes bacterium ADurb.BinA104]|nr:MAG: hypothetical protein BWY95_01368 [Bacteroidetes bacterium ADurb.BinA104]